MSWRMSRLVLSAMVLIAAYPSMALSSGDTDVGAVLEQLHLKLVELRDQGRQLKSQYDKAALIVANLQAQQGRTQVDTRQVVALKQDLDRMGYDARQLRDDMDKKVARLEHYERPLHRRFPQQSPTFGRYFDQLRTLRTMTRQLCTVVTREAPRRARDVERMLRKGFGTYMSGSDALAARSTPPPTVDAATTAPPAADGAVSRADEIRARVRASRTVEEEELDRFFGGSAEDAAANMPSLSGEPTSVQGDDDEPAVYEDDVQRTTPPVRPSDDDDAPAPAPTRTVVATPKPTTAPPPATTAPATKPPAPKASEEDDFGGFGGFEDGGDKPAATPTPTKAPATKPPATNPPATNPPATKPPAAKTDDKKSGKGEDDFGDFMDFDDSAVPVERDEEVAAAPGRQEGFQLFSERMADEFRRHGVVERVAAPPADGSAGAASRRLSGTKNFAARLKEEISKGIPDADELPTAPTVLEETAEPKADGTSTAADRRGLVRQLMREIGRLD